jgi:thioredoxin-like negative regulator of GroEL
MRAALTDLYAELERAPEDWSVRIRLIEAAVTAGDFAEAKRLVRTSPDPDRHLPAELQDRIHSLLTRRDTEHSIEILPRAGDGMA